MTVYAFGDSFTYGYDLSDCDGSQPSGRSYGAKLASLIGSNYKCLAKGSYANNAITRCIIDEIRNLNHDDLVLVMWTYPIRREFLFDTGYYSISPSKQTDFSRCFYKYLDPDPYYWISQSLIDIYLAQSLLDQQQIPYVFMSAVTNLSQAVQNHDINENSIISWIKPDQWLFLDKGLGFEDWARNVLQLNYSGHPPDRAHDVLAQMIQSKLNARS